MVRQSTWTLLACWAMTQALPAASPSRIATISIDAGPLADNLRDLERQTGIELLYDHSLVVGLRSPPVAGAMSTDVALQQILRGSNLTARRAESGAWILERPDAPALAQQDIAVAEILVVGRRTQNADIRRFENDIQPYNVLTQAEIRSAHRDDINQFLSSRVTSNGESLPAGPPRSAEILSTIDIRGLGNNQTLVLVDGRRMPSIPDEGSSFRQSDINGIPLHAIKRIEVLTGTASGIYGFGALGGVVNVILDRETRGLDVHLTGGISSRGDSGRTGLEASYGRTTESGKTDISLFASRFESDRLLVGQRDFSTNDRSLNRHYVPEDFAYEQAQGYALLVRGSSFGPDGNLEFKPEYGGGSLESTRTLLPPGFSGSTTELVDALRNNASQLNLGLTPQLAGNDLGSNPASDSLFANFRHRFNDRFEVFVDAVMLNTEGRVSDDGGRDGFVFLAAASPLNPFTTDVFLDLPILGIEGGISREAEQARYTAGLVAGLPLDWRGTLEIGAGSFTYHVREFDESPSNANLYLFGDAEDPDLNPFLEWNALQQTLAGVVTHRTITSRIRDDFRNYSLRLAGPLFNTSAGPSTLTILAERRTDHVPATITIATNDILGPPISIEYPEPGRSSASNSVYVEFRSRLSGEQAPALLRNLELQLAVRHDEQEFDFALAKVEDVTRSSPEFNVTAFTAGAKISPWPWLMLRASHATGEQPPTIEALRDIGPVSAPFANALDPKRGGRLLGRDGRFLYSTLGNEDLQAVRAKSTFVGVVLTPLGEAGPSFAFDYSRIRRTRDVYQLSDIEVLQHEDELPGRVVREPLTDADRDLGYTAGRIIEFDSSYLNGATLEVDAIDARAEWPMSVLGGRLRLYADATYLLNNRRKEPFREDVQLAGFVNGPLKRRANGGLDWSGNRLTLGANLQYFGSRSVFLDTPEPDFTHEFSERIQGSTRLRSQSYLDLYASWRMFFGTTQGARELVLDLGVVNALDKEPPRESSYFSEFADDAQGFSAYGDPRLQRFELVLTAHF